GDPAIVGKTVQFNSRPFTVIGVTPKGFIGTEVAYDPEMFIPVMMAKTIEPGSTWLDKRDSNHIFTVGRLKPGVSFAQAKVALETLTAKLAQDYPENVGFGIRLGKPGLFIPDIANSVFAFTGVLAAVGGLVLLLACVNLASLLLARATERRPEIAVRLAIGASRQRLVRQLLTERLLISLSGGAAGVFLAPAINSAVRGIRPPDDVTLLCDLRTDRRGRAVQKEMLEQAPALPQIENAALTDYLPLGLNYNESTIYIEGTEFKGASTLPIAIPIESSPGYFDVMGIPLRGRDFRDDENKKESRVAIVNQTFAKKFFNGQDPIGRRFNWHGPKDPFFEIVGVVPDGKYNS